MVQFSAEDKAVKDRKPWFGFGVHDVVIESINGDTTEDGREFLEINVLHPENADINEKVRFWFVGGAVNISFNTLRDIYVHNAPEEAKDAARASFDAVNDTTELVMLLTDKLIGGEAWLTVYYDAKGRTYLDNNGKTQKSINKNLIGYKPEKVRTDLMPKENDAQQSLNAADFPADDKKLDEPFPSNNTNTASNGIPKKTGW